MSYSTKRVCRCVAYVSPSRDDAITCRGPSRRLHMEAPRCDPSPINSVPPPANSFAIVGPPCLASPKLLNNDTVQSAPHAPTNTPAVPIVLRIDVTKAKVPFFIPQPIFHCCFPLVSACREVYERPSQTTLTIFSTPFLFLSSYGVVS